MRCRFRARGFYMFMPPLKGQGPLFERIGFSGVGRDRRRDPGPAASANGVVALRLRTVPLLQRRRLAYSNPNAAFPSPGDALYLAVYPVLIAGLLVLVKRRNPRRDPAALIAALVLRSASACSRGCS